MSLRARTHARGLAWERAYAKRLFATDLVVIVVAVFGAQILRFGDAAAGSRVSGGSAAHGLGFEVGYTAISLAIVVAWMLSLDLFATRDHKKIGSGNTEYKRIADATIRLFGVFAIVAFLAKMDIGRGYVLLAFPIGLVLILLGRWSWRQWLNRRRRAGGYSYRAVLLGHRAKTEHVVANLQRANAAGIRPVGALTEDGRVNRAPLFGVPVLGGFDDVVACVEDAHADTLVLTGADDIDPTDMRRLGWELESHDVNLVVAPALTDVAGPRIHARPVAGLPLIHVDYPTFEGRKQVAKRFFDLVVSALLLAVLSPLFLVLAILVRATSPGPVFFSQVRVGLNGERFRMIKFRSMVQDAEDRLPSLLDRTEGNGVLFKMREDPRVTRVGATLRRYSMDELPQLVNVFRGQMSLVGPRPPLAAEVARYDEWEHRRLLVKPGITGLWQVNGRSDLSWEDSIRLDLYYVENWSMTGDVIILYRTVRAVLKPSGAY